MRRSAAGPASPFTFVRCTAAKRSMKYWARTSTSLARAQRRDVNADDVDAVEEVLAESALGHLGVEVAVRGGDEARVEGDLLVSADRAYRPLLENAQQLRLHPHRHLADLVEEERPPVGLQEQPLARLPRVRERPLRVAEQLALEEVLRHRRAVDGDERPLRVPAPRVDRLRDELLARPALAGDEDRRLSLRDAGDEVVHFLHRSARAEHVAELLLLLHRRAKPLHFLAKLLVGDRALERERDVLHLERLRHEVVRAGADGAYGRLEAAERRDDDDRHVGPVGDHLLAELEPGRALHVQVGDDDVEVLGIEASARRQPTSATPSRTRGA